MPTITGYTEDRLSGVEGTSVVGGAIVGDNLILARKDAVTINAGNVRGPDGPTGPSGTGAMGRIGYVEKTTQQTGISSAVAISGLSVTFTATAGRRYRVSVNCGLYASVYGAIGQVSINDSVLGYVAYARAELASAAATAFRFERIVVPGAGSRTYSVYANLAEGTGTITFDGLPLHPAFIMVEDIGT
jgi:hypothetical protein